MSYNISQGLRQFTAASQLLTQRPAVKALEPEFIPTEGKELLEELNCPVCLKLMTNPRFLECGHTLCQGCLGQWSEQCALCRKKKPRVRTAPSSLERTILEKVKGDCGSCKRQKISLLEWNRHYTQECSGLLCVNAGCQKKVTTSQEEHNLECEHFVVVCPCNKKCNWTGKYKDRPKHLSECEHYQFAERLKSWKNLNKSIVDQVSRLATSQAELHKTASVKIGDYCFKHNLPPPLSYIKQHLVVSHKNSPDMIRVLTCAVSITPPGIVLNGAFYNFQSCLLVLVLDQDQLKAFINNERELSPEFRLYYKPV